MPVRSRTIPTTMPKIEICSAMYETLSFVANSLPR
jgi:hypothetical protein